MSNKKYRPDYNMCSDDAPAVWERERCISFIQEHIDEMDRLRIPETDDEKREGLAKMISRLEDLKDKISWRARTRLRDGELEAYYDRQRQIEYKNA